MRSTTATATMMPITSGERLLCALLDAEEVFVVPGVATLVPPTESVTQTVTVVEVTDSDVDDGCPVGEPEFEVGAPCVLVEVGLALPPPTVEVNGMAKSGTQSCVSPASTLMKSEFAMVRLSPTASTTKLLEATSVDQRKNVVVMLV